MPCTFRILKPSLLFSILIPTVSPLRDIRLKDGMVLDRVSELLSPLFIKLSELLSHLLIISDFLSEICNMGLALIVLVIEEWPCLLHFLSRHLLLFLFTKLLIFINLLGFVLPSIPLFPLLLYFCRCNLFFTLFIFIFRKSPLPSKSFILFLVNNLEW